MKSKVDLLTIADVDKILASALIDVVPLTAVILEVTAGYYPT